MDKLKIEIFQRNTEVLQALIKEAIKDLPGYSISLHVLNDKLDWIQGAYTGIINRVDG